MAFLAVHPEDGQVADCADQEERQKDGADGHVRVGGGYSTQRGCRRSVRRMSLWLLLRSWWGGRLV